MTHCSLPLDHLPAALAAEVTTRWDHFAERHPEHCDWLCTKLDDDAFARQLAKVWACSSFVAELCLRRPEFLRTLIDEQLLSHKDEEGDMRARLQGVLAAAEDGDQLSALLRQCRGREMLRIIWRDLNRLADLTETTRDISALADAAIDLALDFHHRQLCQSLGMPMAKVDGELQEQRMVVLGMGKLGAFELNLSSDIDLIFTYPAGGETEGGPKCVDNQTFFTRLGKRLIQALDQPTAEGFVFRTDMRLRPYGESGALALNFDAMEEYYQDQGRDWERYAMIKARVVAGDKEQGELLMKALRPFTYRRYIDFSAIESLRSMKAMIQKEVQRRRLHNNIKLGNGGIREVEFIAQCFQLIRGGREPELQERRLRKVLALLAEKGYLPEQAATELIDAYVFLRNAEHAIQAFNDRQTQELPDTDYPRQALACAMDFDNWESFEVDLKVHREAVDRHFHAVIAAPDDEAEQEKPESHRWVDLWEGHLDLETAQLQFEQAGHEDSAAALKWVKQLQSEPTVVRMQTVARERLDQFMPLLLEAVTAADNPSATLQRILPLVEAVLRRTAYLVLLVENPVALKQLVVLCSASPWISTLLARHPVLLDELLDARTLYTTPDKSQLRDELRQQTVRLAWDDLEVHMEALRYFKQSQVLRVAASEVAGVLPLMKVSDYLTYIAEVILEHVLELAWQNLVEKHGRPRNLQGQPCDKDFIIVGYGKLGGIELGYGSDLDLVFIHDAAANTETDGPRPVDSSVFFTRLGQRMIHILTAQTPLGQLYEVDMRLRPSGASGLLVSSLSAFTDYQNKEAWTWEHQALARARVVAGDISLAGGFEQVRKEVLAAPRDHEQIRNEVREMRRKMSDHLRPKESETEENPFFHLKHGSGGIVDIEFMVQYAALVWSQDHPALAIYSDNIRMLEALENAGLFSEAEAAALTEAYKAYRVDAHRLSLQQQKAIVPLDKFAEQRKAVIAKWRQLIEP